jgi:hypothetical protein
MTHPAPSVASHVNASEIMDPVGVAVGETLDVTAINSGHAVSENIDPAGAQIGETAMEDINRENGNSNGISGGPSSSSSTQTATKDTTTNSTTNTSAKETRSEQELDELWTSNYNALCAFHAETGHTRVHRKSGPLGSWVSRQRGYYKSNLKGKSTPLTKERIQLMEELGFIWGYNIKQSEMSQTPQNQIRLNEIWSNHLKDLREYQTQHGHIRVPRKSGPLGEWARCQRSYNRLNGQGQSTPLTAERKQLLDEMGFDFHPTGDKTGAKRKRVGVDGEEPMEGEQQQGSGGGGVNASQEFQHQIKLNEIWSNRLQELRLYQIQHKLTRVPYMVPGALGRWIRTQRKNNRLDEEQGKSTPLLTAERKKILDEMGFNWGKQNPLERDERKQVAKQKRIIEQKNLSKIAWFNQLKDLREFQTQHGHIRVPKKSGPLWKWVRNQRHYNRLNEEGQQSTQLTTERKQLLDGIGFIWNPDNRAGEHKREMEGKDTHKRKRKRLNGAEPVGASGGQVMTIKCEEQQEGGGDTKLEEPLLMSTPAQRKTHEECNDLVQLLPGGEENLTEMWNRLNGTEPGGASRGPQAMAIKGEEQGGGDAKGT